MSCDSQPAADTIQAGRYRHFKGGEYAEVYVEGRGTSDLNLYVYDAQNRLVCSDTDISDIAYCGWRPAKTAAFSVKVENKGKSGAPYSMMTN